MVVESSSGSQDDKPSVLQDSVASLALMVALHICSSLLRNLIKLKTSMDIKPVLCRAPVVLSLRNERGEPEVKPAEITHTAP